MMMKMNGNRETEQKKRKEKPKYAQSGRDGKWT